MELQFGTGHKHKMSCSWRQEGNICNDLITIYLIIKLKCVQQESNWHVQVCRMKNCSAINMRWSTSYPCLFLITKYYFAFNNFFILFILFQSNFVPNLNIYWLFFGFFFFLQAYTATFPTAFCWMHLCPHLCRLYCEATFLCCVYTDSTLLSIL